MGAGAGQTGGGMQQMPQQTAMQQAMPVGAPAQSGKGGLGALAAQRQQGGQADPRLMAMMQALGGNRPQPAMPMNQQAAAQAAQMQAMPQQQMGQRVDQFGRPSATGQFAFDPGQQLRMAQAGLNPDQLAQMSPDQLAQFQPSAPVDIDPRTGMPVQQMPGMAAPGGGLSPGFPGGQRVGVFGPNDMPVQYDPRKPGGVMDVPVQRPMPVGAGGKGAGMPRPGVPVQRPMPLPPGLSRPMPMPLPPALIAQCLCRCHPASIVRCRFLCLRALIGLCLCQCLRRVGSILRVLSALSLRPFARHRSP